MSKTAPDQPDIAPSDLELDTAWPAGGRFVAPTPWSPARPETLVVCCSDGRWHEQVEDFVRSEVSERADLYAVPGGPASFNLWGSSFDEAKGAEAALRFLAEHHELESVWLIAHQQCAYYRTKYGQLDEPLMRRRQEEDLARAKGTIQRCYPDLRVRRVYAALEGDRVVFGTLPDEWS
jgi:hypothetical protein